MPPPSVSDIAYRVPATGISREADARLPENLSLFQPANGAVGPDRPVPFRVITGKAGKKLVKFKVPGLRRGWGGCARINADRVARRGNLIPLHPGLKIPDRGEPGAFSTPIRLERGIRYTFSALASRTNPEGNWIVISAGFADKDNKVLPSGTTACLHRSRASALPMKLLPRSFCPPAGAVSARLFFRVYAPDQEMMLRKFSLVAEPFKARVETRDALLHKELKPSCVPGKWELKVCDIDSGVTETAVIELK